MAYSSNPLLPKARRMAVNLVTKEGLTVACAARRSGIHRSTLHRWLQKVVILSLDGRAYIPTISSRPHHHPWEISEIITSRIIALRTELKRCALVIWHVMVREGHHISLSSVHRTLYRRGYLDKRHGQKGKQHVKRSLRPPVKLPGDLVQMDTIHFSNWKTKEKYYVYTLIDLKTRWTYAEYAHRICPADTIAFVNRAQRAAPFVFRVIQTDNGQEFSKQLERHLNTVLNITQRRIRLGKKNDNAHIERFNRTLQDECLGRWPAQAGLQKRLAAYLDFYNTKRLHLGIQCYAPADVLQRF